MDLKCKKAILHNTNVLFTIISLVGQNENMSLPIAKDQERGILNKIIKEKQ
jgi:hypothetical protein